VSSIKNSNSKEAFEVSTSISSVKNLYSNFRSSFLVTKLESTFGVFVVSSSDSRASINLMGNSLPFALNSAIRIVLTVNMDNTVTVGNRVTDSRFFKTQTTGFVIIEDGNFALGITADKSLFCVGVVEFDEEVFIRLPSFIVNNLNLNDFILLIGVETDNSVNSFEVFRGGGSITYSADTNSGRDFKFVDDGYTSVIVSLGDGKMEATEAETVVFLALFE
jgi:hypothetical protein